MKKLLLSVAAAVLTVIGLSSVATMSPAYAEDPDTSGAKNPASQYVSDVKPTGVPGEGKASLMSIIKDIINVVIGIVGVIAVVMMIIGGISFITSQGDTNKVTKARNTILYGVVGLIVALLAFAIVNFVLGSLFSMSGEDEDEVRAYEGLQNL